jgi:hypothetical protein
MDGRADRVLDGGACSGAGARFSRNQRGGLRGRRRLRACPTKRRPIIVGVEPRPLPWQRTPEGLPPQKTAAGWEILNCSNTYCT